MAVNAWSLPPLAPSRDHRAAPYSFVAMAAIGMGLMTGRAEPMAVGAAIAAVVVLGFRRTDPLTVPTAVSASAERVIVGNEVTTIIDITAPPNVHLSADVIDTASDLGAPRTRLVERTARGARIEVAFPTRRWGKYHLGTVTIRAAAPGGLVVWQGPVADLGTVTVLPSPDRIDAILSPPATQISSGAHLARTSAGDGSEFSDIREHRPGDRLRDVNWKVSARRPEAYVTRRHPERGGDVVIVLDAVPDLGWKQSPIGAAVLQRMGQAAWALARNHLAGQDRVGLLVPHAGQVAWLPPRGGGRAKYVLLDQLMRSVEPADARRGAVAFHGQVRSSSVVDRHDIPPSALVIGLSTLTDHDTLMSLAALRQHGRSTAVLAFDSTHEVRRHHATLDADTVRLGTMLFDARAQYLRRTATPVVTVRADDDIGRSVERLAELASRSLRRRPAA